MGTRNCQHICSESNPTVGEAGLTGEWRSLRPVIDRQKCTPSRLNKLACFQCWLYCPEAIISKTTLVQVNLEYCKGCGICAQVCPTQAINMVSEGICHEEGE